MTVPPSCSPTKLARGLVYALVLFIALLCVTPASLSSSAYKPAGHLAGASSTPVWYRGNTHAHTTNSDGDSSPASVASRYRDLGYNFLFITDHNKLTDVEDLNAELGVAGQFLVIRGEELTDSFNGKPVHINGLNNSSAVLPQQGVDVLSTIENDTAAIRRAGGLPYIAHPNFGFAITADDLKRVTGSALFEVYNAHPVVNNVGDATHPSVEAMWDEALSSGKLLYGLAADDEHNLFKAGGALPGQAWVMVRAASLDAGAITQALERGDFYASTGVTLQDYQLSATGITITVDEALSGQTTIDFIGKNGRLLRRSTNSPAVYNFTGDEMYVRAKITAGGGKAAWTQPVYTARLSPTDAILNGASLGNEPGTGRVIAPDSIAVATGLGLAAGTQQTQRQPGGAFPTSVAGTTVTINGRLAPIYYASSTQVNFYVPAETETGTADVVVANADGVRMRSQIRVAGAAPGVFTVDGTGRGNAFFVETNTLFCSFFMPDDGARRLHLYATGVRGAAQLQITLNGLPVTVEAVKACRGLQGLDQINIAIPPNTLPIGGVGTLIISADGSSSNPTTLRL
jgi:uncharacterized protein (TIGR03437 family)